MARARTLAALAVAAALALLWLATREPRGNAPADLVLHWRIPVFAADAAATWAAGFAIAALLARAPRTVLLRGALATGSLVLLGAALELPAWLGWIDYRSVVGLAEHERFTRLKPWQNPSNLRDEELLFRHRPGAAFHGRIAGDLVALYGIATDRRYEVDVRYDERGFRNPPGLERADVALIGDSFVEGGLVGDRELVSARLAELTGLAVANLGHSGYGPEQELVVLRRYGLPLHPSRVVWFFFEGNDLLDTGRLEQARADPEFLDPQRSRFESRSLFKNLLLRLALSTERRRTEDSAEAVSRSALFPAPAGGVASGGESASGAERIYFAFPLEPLADADLARLELVRATLREAAELCRQSGAELLVVFAPVKLRVYGGLCAFPEASRFTRREPNDLPARLGDIARELGAAWLDLTPALHAAAAAGELVYFADDGHWNARGHAVAAGAVAGALRGAGAPPGGER